MERNNGLTEQMRTVLLTRVLCGSHAETAHKLNLAPSTISNTLRNVYHKLGAADLAGAYHKYLVSQGDQIAKEIDENFR